MKSQLRRQTVCCHFDVGGHNRAHGGCVPRVPRGGYAPGRVLCSIGMQCHSSVYDSALIALTWHWEVHTMTYFVAVVDVTIRINKLNK